jgi:hypothetical protein
VIEALVTRNAVLVIDDPKSNWGSWTSQTSAIIRHRSGRARSQFSRVLARVLKIAFG